VSRRVVYYSIIQVVPDPARGERLNIGVVAWDPEGDTGAARFASFRQRLRALGVEDSEFAEEFRDWLTDALKAPSDRLFVVGDRAADSRWDLEAMRAGSEWGGMIQLTDVRPARGDSATDVARWVYERAVRLSQRPSSPEPGKSAVRRAVAAHVRNAIRERFPAPPVGVRTRVDVPGRRATHSFDVGLLNGKVAGAMVTPNFANPKTADVVKDLEAAIWAIIDVRESEHPVPFAVAASMQPAPRRVRTAVSILEEEGASVLLGESSAWDEWAVAVAASALSVPPE
jgi:hypothetical protein